MNTTEQTSDPTLWRYPSLWSANRTIHLRNLEAKVAELENRVSELEGPHNDAIWHLVQERDSERRTVSMWLGANATGGWIDNLRSQLEEARCLLCESNDLLNEVAAFGNCDCDIPNGVTCVPCQCATHINKTKAWLSAHTPTGKEK